MWQTFKTKAGRGFVWWDVGGLAVLRSVYRTVDSGHWAGPGGKDNRSTRDREYDGHQKVSNAPQCSWGWGLHVTEGGPRERAVLQGRMMGAINSRGLTLVWLVTGSKLMGSQAVRMIRDYVNYLLVLAFSNSSASYTGQH